MSNPYWQAKIWGLLHDPALKALHDNSGRGGEGPWDKLECMASWVSPKSSEDKKEGGLSGTWLEHVGLSDLVASASDRGAIHYLGTSIDYHAEGLQISHLLSGEKLNLTLEFHGEIIRQAGNRRDYLNQQESSLIDSIPLEIRQDAEKCFWWLWRCLPERICERFGAQSLLMPAETRFPDASIWSHGAMTSALAGALAGYDTAPEEIQKNAKNTPKSRPYLATFTFSPVQELIKASRKIKDFWAGSWLLHYLSAKVCWRLAQKYGPDCFLYPSLYEQPLIDYWLRQDGAFAQVIPEPEERRLLTAGFPNVIMLILPEAKVAAAMQTAKNYLLESWQEIAHLVFLELTQNRHWQKDLKETDSSWKNWLGAQWQTYWAAMPIGAKELTFKSVGIPAQTKEKKKERDQWIEGQNQALNGDLFKIEEIDFIEKATELYIASRNNRNYAGSLNVGSWWGEIFDQSRLALNAVKNARTWKVPTAFGPRSTISGLGPVAHPQLSHDDWITEGETQKYWQRNAGLFDGSEQLNATEIVKRGLEKILPELFKETSSPIKAYYPDLTVGVAGYLKNFPQALEKFNQACSTLSQKITQDHREVARSVTQEWGIPWIDDHADDDYNRYHPRFLNPGWLVEELENLDKEDLVDYRQELQNTIQEFYPHNNPTHWYVIAAGDGDGMSEWLKGAKMNPYGAYFPDALDSKISAELRPAFDQFKEAKKRMGPATHSALSRALLDFSNQLVPYLTEQRYAGRLIYSGGDDVLAYTNLWEWDSWLWDVRQCFRGAEDPHKEFNNEGNYWRLKTPRDNFPRRPLFTMGKTATISFGLVLAHHSVPLAIALENLWEAEEEAKEFEYFTGQYHPQEKYAGYRQKDAIQARVIYGNGNILKATCQFEVFGRWKTLIESFPQLDASLFEQAAQLLNAHPIPDDGAIGPWVNAFVQRREQLKALEAVKQEAFVQQFAQLMQAFWETNRIDLQESAGARQQTEERRDQEIKNWLKLAAFVKRNRSIL